VKLAPFAAIAIGRRAVLGADLLAINRLLTDAIKCRARVARVPIARIYCHSSVMQWYCPLTPRRTRRRVSDATRSRQRDRRGHRFAQPISRKTTQRKCPEMIQYRGTFPKSSASLCKRYGRTKKGADTSPGACAEGRTRLSDHLPRRSTLSARTTRTPAAARDSIRANFDGPMKETEDRPGIWRKKSIIIRLTRQPRERRRHYECPRKKALVPGFTSSS